MAEVAVRAGASPLAHYVPWLGFSLAVLSAPILAAAPAGWRMGLWHFRTAFWRVMVPAFLVGTAAAVVSLAVLFWWSGMSGSGRAMAMRLSDILCK